MKKNVVRILALVLVGLMCLSLLPAIGHADWCSHDSLTTVTVEPVCGEDGYTAAVCQICGEMFGTEIIPHTEEHDFSACVMADDYLISLGDCLTPTLYYKSCSKCGQIAEFAYQSAMMQMQQDLWDQYNRELAYYGAAVTDWEARIRQATEEIQNQYTFKVGGEGHRFYEVERQPATCLDDGWEAYRVCEECGAVEGYQAIPAKGHRFGDYTVTREPTCTEAGLRQRVCEVCGEVEEETVPALGHKGPFTTVKAPTCTEPGSEKRICTVCQAEEIREIPALGHKGPFTVTKEATCTEDGVQERDCTVCGAHETAVIPAAHKYGEDNHCVFCGVENPNRPAVSDTETFGSENENSDSANLEDTTNAQPEEEQGEQLVEQYGGVEDTETFAVGEYTVTLSCAGGKYSAYEIALADTDTLTATCDKDTGNLIYYWIRETSDGVEQKIMKNGAVYEGKTYTPSSSELNGTIRCAVKEIGSEKEAGRSDAWRVRAERTITLVTSGKGTMKYARERLGWETEKIDLELPENPTEYHSKDYTFLTGDSITLSMEPDTENHYLFRIIGILSGNVYQSKRTIADPNPYTFTVTSDQNYLLQSDLSNLYRETNPTTSADKDIKTSGIAQKALNDTLIPEIAGRYGVNPNAVKPSAITYVTPIWYSDAIAMRDFEINAIGGFDFPLDYPNDIGENDEVLVFHFSGTSASGEWKQVSKSQYTPGSTAVEVEKYTDFSPFVVLGLNNVTVTYKSGYDESITSSENKIKGTTFTAPACSFEAPTDKAFKNWKDSDGVEYEVGDTIPKTGTLSKDYTLTAQWIDGHTITFDKNNANATGSMDKLFVLDGEERALTKNAFELKNHAFAGWSTTPDGEKVYDDEEKITPTENLNLYAKWNRTHSTVSFDPHGGSGSMSSQTGELGGKITLAKNAFQNDGKLFSGWAIKEGGEVVYTDGQTISVPDSDQTLYAVWDYKVTVRYSPESDKASGTGTMADQTVPGGRKFTLTRNSFKAPNMFVFNGWNTVKDGSGTAYADGQEIAEGLTEDTTLYAQWKRTAYTVTYVGNGGTGSMNTQTIPANGAVAISQNGFTAPYGKTFVGWSKTAGVDNTIDYTAGTPIRWDDLNKEPYGDLTLYAVWRDNVTVSFDKNNADASGSMAAQTMLRGVEDTLNANSFKAPADYEFKYWTTTWYDPYPDKFANEVTADDVYKDESKITPTASMTLYAQWQRAVFYVSFDANRDDATGTMANQKLSKNVATALNANSFKAANWQFVGWNTEKDGSGTSYNDKGSISVSEDTNLYAQWKRTAYTVTYVGNGGTGSMNTQTIPLKGAVGISQNGFTAPYGKAFLGWSEDPDALEENPVYNPGQKLEASTLEARNADLTLYAVWGEIITVHFYPTDGQQTGTGTMADQQLIRGKADSLNANKFTAPADYKFAGWNTQPDGTGTPYADGKTFTKDELKTLPSTLNLYAQWERSIYNVSFDKNREDATGTMAVQKMDADRESTLNAVAFKAPTDYVFKYWTKTAADPYPDMTADEVTTDDVYKDRAKLTPTDDMLLYAQWERSVYNVSFDKNNADATGTMSSQKVARNAETSLNAVSFKAPANFAFKYWTETADDPYPDQSADVVTATDIYRDRAAINTAEKRLSGDVTLYAQWERVSYSVIYNANGGTGTTASQTIPKDGGVEAAANRFTAPAGRIFIGWARTAGQENDVSLKAGDTIRWEDLNREPYTDLTLYAVWKDKVTITFNHDSDSGSGTGTMAAQEAPKGEKVTLNANKFTAPTGMAFGGWNTKADGTGTAYADSAEITPTENITLYAQWLEDACTVTFDKNNDAVEGEAYTQSILKNTATALKENQFIAPKGLAFNGWNTKRDGTGTAFKDKANVKVSKDITLYAQWINAATVTFNKNADDATGTMTAQVVETGVDTPLTANAFKRINYSFDGWTTNPDGTGDKYADQGSINTLTDVTLYAVWKQIAYAITYDANGGGGSQMPQQNVSVGSTATIRDCAYNPKPGEVFAYWKEDRVYSMTQAGESGSEHSDIYYPGEKIIPTRDMDLKAIWVDELVISYYPGEGSGTYNTGEVPKGVETSVKTASEAQFTPPANATFAYWQDGAGNRYYEGKQYVFNANTSLTAVWAPAVTITYNKNASDASGSMASQSVPSGVEVTLHENRFSRSEYIFKYWTKTKSDPYPNKDPKDVTTNDVYKDGTNITIAQDTALYAQWYKTAISANAVLITGEVTGLDDFAVWGETLTAVVNDPVLKSGFTYTWQVDGNPVKSGSDNTYLVSKEDYGKPIVCVVSHPQATNEVESNTKIVGTYAEDDDLIIINNGSDAYPYSKYAYVYGVVPGTTFYKDGKEYLVPESAADGFMEIGIPGTYTFGYATYYIENWFTVGYEVDTTGSSGTVSMKNGSTTLTSTTRTADIQHFVNTIWLVRDGSATDLNITMTPASSTYVHWSLNGGNYSSSGAAVSRRLGTINQPMLFSVVFNKSSTSPKTGDMSNLGLWSALCFTSFVGTAIVLGKARKGKKTRA